VSRPVTSSLVAVALVFGASLTLACFEHAKCDDKVLSSLKSPDGKYVVTAAHRTCQGSEYTWVKVETVPSWFGSDPVIRDKIVMSVPVKAPVTTVWLDPTHLEIVSPAVDLIEGKDDPYERHWRDLELSYRRSIGGR